MEKSFVATGFIVQGAGTSVAVEIEKKNYRLMVNDLLEICLQLGKETGGKKENELGIIGVEVKCRCYRDGLADLVEIVSFP